VVRRDGHRQGGRFRDVPGFSVAHLVAERCRGYSGNWGSGVDRVRFRVDDPDAVVVDVDEQLFSTEGVHESLLFSKCERTRIDDRLRIGEQNAPSRFARRGSAHRSAATQAKRSSKSDASSRASASWVGGASSGVAGPIWRSRPPRMKRRPPDLFSRTAWRASGKRPIYDVRFAGLPFTPQPQRPSTRVPEHQKMGQVPYRTALNRHLRCSKQMLMCSSSGFMRQKIGASHE
jgi:hypothetical protein